MTTATQRYVYKPAVAGLAGYAGTYLLEGANQGYRLGSMTVSKPVGMGAVCFASAVVAEGLKDKVIPMIPAQQVSRPTANLIAGPLVAGGAAYVADMAIGGGQGGMKEVAVAGASYIFADYVTHQMMG